MQVKLLPATILGLSLTIVVLLHPIKLPAQTPNGLLINPTRIAQMDNGDAYDPFADYSEFQEDADEEEDLNFFRNGRFFTIGAIIGYRGFTQNYGSMYSGAPLFGATLSYFFDLRFAMEVAFVTSSHVLDLNATDPSSGVSQQIVGSMGLTDLMVHVKYYLNTQNVTRGLASLNPYLVGGISELFRTTHVSGEPVSAKDDSMAFDLGAGVELPMMRNKMYLGLEALYQILNFSDEGTGFPLPDGNSSGFDQTGNSYLVLSTLGVNF